MRKTALLSILALTVMVLASCSGGSKQVPGEDGSSRPAATADSAKDTAVEATTAEEKSVTEEREESSGAGINVSLGETGENMSLPDSYPTEVFPLPGDANIVNVNENPDNKSTGIILKTGKNFDEALAYCQDIMKGGTITLEDKKDDSYILMGSKDKYSIMITVSKYNGENISILFNVTPQ